MHTTDTPAAAPAPVFNPFPAWSTLDLQARLRVLMAVRGISVHELAEASGISVAGIGSILRNAHGGGRNDIDTLRRLATAFEISFGDLISGL